MMRIAHLHMCPTPLYSVFPIEMISCFRVFFVIPSLGGGGAERVVTTLSQFIDKRRFDITLILVNAQNAVFLKDIPPEIEVIDLALPRVRSAAFKILQLVWQRKPHIVFSTLSHLNLMLCLLRPFFPQGVKLVGRETSVVSESLNGKPARGLWSAAYRWIYPRLDYLVCQSIDMRNDLLNNFSFPASNACIINNPVDVDRVRQLAALLPDQSHWVKFASDTDIRLVVAGRLVQQKGIDMLIQAVALCKNPKVRVLVLGHGPLKDKLLELAARLGVASQVRLAGFEANPYPYIASADALVLSSRYEGFPNVVLESLACGTPVIAMPAPGGCREILSGLAGCELADEVSAPALARAMQRWIDGPRTRMGDEAVAPYSVRAIVGQYQDMLADVATRK